MLLDENQPNFTEGFAKLSGALVCRGAYPRVLSLAWKKYQKEQGSENDLPEFKDNQEYVVLESDLYGNDVESYTFVNSKQALSLLVQVAHTLGVGEAGVKFEHRDRKFSLLPPIFALIEYLSAFSSLQCTGAIFS